jgi:hypothetical protein
MLQRTDGRNKNHMNMKTSLLGPNGVFRSKTPVALLVASIIVVCTGCNGEKILVANFNGNTLGLPPASGQEVVTVQTMPPAQNSVVATVPGLPSNWVKITRPNDSQVIAGIIGTATSAKGEGIYTFTSTLYIPDNGGVATIQFEPFGQIPPGLAFFHIDFLENNTVRVNDDNGTAFGSFPRNQPFMVQVTLNILASGSTADIVLSGADATGSFHVPAFTGGSFAPQFGSVRLWMGFPWVGSFYATNIVVEHK